jgi:hypothetical protein
LRAPDHEEDAVTLRSCSVLAATVGLWLAHPAAPSATAQALPQTPEPGRLSVESGQALTPGGDVSANQRLANRIAEQMGHSGRLRGFRIEITVENGVVELSGQVGDEAQRAEALQIAQGVPGVAAVRDRMALTGSASLTRVTAVTQPVMQEPGPLMGKDIPPGAAAAEPTPIFQAPPGLPYASQNPPPMPPYAWPTYAPYNNFSRVAYPTLYPYQAWPFIGPMYPFPKVPLGWRSIRLTYYDGCWWYGKRACGHDWWRIKYW